MQTVEQDARSSERAIEIAAEMVAAIAELAMLPSNTLTTRFDEPIKNMADLTAADVRDLAARAGFVGSMFAAVNLRLYALYFQSRHPFLSKHEAMDMAEQASLAVKSVADAIGYSAYQLFDSRASEYCERMGVSK